MIDHNLRRVHTYTYHHHTTILQFHCHASRLDIDWVHTKSQESDSYFIDPIYSEDTMNKIGEADRIPAGKKSKTKNIRILH